MGLNINDFLVPVQINVTTVIDQLGQTGQGFVSLLRETHSHVKRGFRHPNKYTALPNRLYFPIG